MPAPVGACRFNTTHPGRSDPGSPARIKAQASGDHARCDPRKSDHQAGQAMPPARREESNDHHLLLGRFFGVDRLRPTRTTTSTPTRNSGALTPRGGSTAPAQPASGPTCFTASISTPSPPTRSNRCRRVVATSWHEGPRPDRQAATRRHRDRRARGDGTLPIRASEPLAREETVPMTTYCKEALSQSI